MKHYLAFSYEEVMIILLMQKTRNEIQRKYQRVVQRKAELKARAKRR